MKKKSYKLLFLLAFLLNCISVRVYVPEESTANKITLPQNQLIAHQVKELTPKSYFATSSFFVFGTSQHANEYGSASKLVEDYLAKYPEKYQQPLQVEITNFELKSNDKCYKNIVSIKLEANVKDARNNEVMRLNHTNEIDSLVSTCTEVWTSLPIFIGWFWYAPYLGFRGTRQDQINQLGSIAFSEFFIELDKALGLKLPPAGKK
jgi:hypothetical protein